MSQKSATRSLFGFGQSTDSSCQKSFLSWSYAVDFPSLSINQRTSGGGQVGPPETKDVATGTSCKLVDAPLHGDQTRTSTPQSQNEYESQVPAPPPKLDGQKCKQDKYASLNATPPFRARARDNQQMQVCRHGDSGILEGLTKGIQEREKPKTSFPEYVKEILEIIELEDKLQSKMKELHDLPCYKSNNEHRRKSLREHFELRDPSMSGYIGRPYKMETWYFLTKKEAMLHILFEKYLESCSFIKYDSTPATVMSEFQEPLFKYLPEELIKTGLQRRINRLKKLKEIEIFMRFTVDMIKISHTLRDRPFVDMCVSIKKDKRFSYLDYLDDYTFRDGFTKFMTLFPRPPHDNIEHMMRTLERRLNDWFTGKYRSILMWGEIVENDVVYYNAFIELEKESGNHGFGDLEGSCDKQARISMAVSDNQWSEVEKQEETIDEVNAIKKPGKMDQSFGLHKWTIEVDRNSKLTAKVTFQTRHGEISSGLPESGFVRRAPNTCKTKRERLQSQIYIIEQEIVGQEDIASKYDFKVASSKEASKDDDNMIEVKLGETSSDIHKVKLEETINYDVHKIDHYLDDACLEKVVDGLLNFEQYFDTSGLIKVDSSPEDIVEKLKFLPVSRKHAEFVIQRRIREQKARGLYEKCTNFLTYLVDYRPYIEHHEKFHERYDRLKADDKLYDLSYFMAHSCFQFFCRLLLSFEEPYDPRLREAHRADLLFIINTACKIECRARVKEIYMEDYENTIYKKFIVESNKRRYTPKVCGKVKTMLALHRKFDSLLASNAFINLDSSPEELLEDKSLVPKEYSSILPTNLILQSIKFRLLILKKQHELHRFSELVRHLCREYSECFDEEQVLRVSCVEFSDVPKHVILRGIQVWKRTLECEDASNSMVRFSIGYPTCELLSSRIMEVWEKTRYYEDEIYEVPLTLKKGEFPITVGW